MTFKYLAYFFIILFFNSCINQNKPQEKITNQNSNINNKILENSISELYEQFLIEFSRCNSNKVIINFYGDARIVKDEMIEINKKLDDFISLAKKQQHFGKEEHNILSKRINNFNRTCLKIKSANISIDHIDASSSISSTSYILELIKLKTAVNVITQSTLTSLFIQMTEYIRDDIISTSSKSLTEGVNAEKE